LTEAPEKPKYELEIDGIGWNRIPGQKYGTDFCRYMIEADKVGMPRTAQLAELMKASLWFLVYFGMRVSIANDPWWIQCCKDVQNGSVSHTLDLWAREHGKTTIITQGETIRRILLNPEERIGIFSYSRPAALSILRGIKQILEGSTLLKACFPHILYQEPRTQADKWSESDGLIVQRKGFYKEATLEAWGLIEGMPTGKHFSGRIYDDVETADLVNSPEVMSKLSESFDMSQNLGTIDGWHKVIGTTYHHEGLLNKLRHRVTPDGVHVYQSRIKPATVDGTPNGPSAYLPEKRLAELRINRQMFYSQQLLDPTPQGTQKLDASYLVEVSPAEIPTRLFKFMAVDPAGERKSDNRQGDSWALVVAGVEPYRDDIGMSRVFILDMMVEPMTEAEALDNIYRMFMRNNGIRQLGVEKVGISTAEIHIAKLLHARGRNLTVENGGLTVLRPAGRKKEQRIEAALQYPLLHRKLHMSTAVPVAYRERFKLEMQRFPYYHDDALDAVSYIYDMIRDFRFGTQSLVSEEDRWEKAKQRRALSHKTDSWLYV
jgi:hypothetical protein